MAIEGIDSHRNTSDDQGPSQRERSINDGLTTKEPDRGLPDLNAEPAHVLQPDSSSAEVVDTSEQIVDIEAILSWQAPYVADNALEGDVVEVEHGVLASPSDRLLTRQETEQKIAEFESSLKDVGQAIERLRQQSGLNDPSVSILSKRMAEVEHQLKHVRLESADNRPIPLSTFEKIAGVIVRVGTVTVVGAVLGPATLAISKKVIVAHEIVVGATTGFVAGVSNEVANLLADPTSHRHHG